MGARTFIFLYLCALALLAAKINSSYGLDTNGVNFEKSNIWSLELVKGDGTPYTQEEAERYCKYANCKIIKRVPGLDEFFLAEFPSGVSKPFGSDITTQGRINTRNAIDSEFFNVWSEKIEPIEMYQRSATTNDSIPHDSTIEQHASSPLLSNKGLINSNNQYPPSDNNSTQLQLQPQPEGQNFSGQTYAGTYEVKVKDALQQNNASSRPQVDVSSQSNSGAQYNGSAISRLKMSNTQYKQVDTQGYSSLNKQEHNHETAPGDDSYAEDKFYIKKNNSIHGSVPRTWGHWPHGHSGSHGHKWNNNHNGHGHNWNNNKDKEHPNKFIGQTYSGDDYDYDDMLSYYGAYKTRKSGDLGYAHTPNKNSGSVNAIGSSTGVIKGSEWPAVSPDGGGVDSPQVVHTMTEHPMPGSQTEPGSKIPQQVPGNDVSPSGGGATSSQMVHTVSEHPTPGSQIEPGSKIPQQVPSNAVSPDGGGVASPQVVHTMTEHPMPGSQTEPGSKISQQVPGNDVSPSGGGATSSQMVHTVSEHPTPGSQIEPGSKVPQQVPSNAVSPNGGGMASSQVVHTISKHPMPGNQIEPGSKISQQVPSNVAHGLTGNSTDKNILHNSGNNKSNNSSGASSNGGKEGPVDPNNIVAGNNSKKSSPIKIYLNAMKGSAVVQSIFGGNNSKSRINDKPKTSGNIIAPTKYTVTKFNEGGEHNKVKEYPSPSQEKVVASNEKSKGKGETPKIQQDESVNSKESDNKDGEHNRVKESPSPSQEKVIVHNEGSKGKGDTSKIPQSESVNSKESKNEGGEHNNVNEPSSPTQEKVIVHSEGPKENGEPPKIPQGESVNSKESKNEDSEHNKVNEPSSPSQEKVIVPNKGSKGKGEPSKILQNESVNSKESESGDSDRNKVNEPPNSSQEKETAPNEGSQGKDESPKTLQGESVNSKESEGAENGGPKELESPEGNKSDNGIILTGEIIYHDSNANDPKEVLGSSQNGNSNPGTENTIHIVVEPEHYSDNKPSTHDELPDSHDSNNVVPIQIFMLGSGEYNEKLIATNKQKLDATTENTMADKPVEMANNPVDSSTSQHTIPQPINNPHTDSSRPSVNAHSSLGNMPVNYIPSTASTAVLTTSSGSGNSTNVANSHSPENSNHSSAQISGVANSHRPENSNHSSAQISGSPSSPGVAAPSNTKISGPSKSQVTHSFTPPIVIATPTKLPNVHPKANSVPETLYHSWANHHRRSNIKNGSERGNFNDQVPVLLTLPYTGGHVANSDALKQAFPYDIGYNLSEPIGSYNAIQPAGGLHGVLQDKAGPSTPYGNYYNLHDSTPQKSNNYVNALSSVNFIDDNNGGERKAGKNNSINVASTVLPSETGSEQKDISAINTSAIKQWHILNRGLSDGRYRGNDINAIPVWRMGYNGTGINIAIIDSGFDIKHDDLARKFDPAGSVSMIGGDIGFELRDIADNHGTRNSGLIYANYMGGCSVGVAPGSKMSAIVVPLKSMNEYYESVSFTYMRDYNSIYVISWGPRDDGKTMSRPRKMSDRALKTGVEKGRSGLGSVYVIAAGNGAHFGDNCNFDGYVNSPYTLAIGSITNRNVKANYSEECSSLLAATYSGGGDDDIRTTDVNNGCTMSHTGTSASAPIAAGVIGLMLSARSDLSWRDIQQIIIDNAVKVDTIRGGWRYNASGRSYSHKYGFGSLDAYALVRAALNYSNLPEELKPAEAYSKPDSELRIPAAPGQNPGIYSEIVIDEDNLNGIESAESVHVTLSFEHKRRGNLSVDLISPNGTISNLAVPRSRDAATSGFHGWTFSTMATWGENPVGTWRLVLTEGVIGSDDNSDTPISIYNYPIRWKLTIRGTCSRSNARYDGARLICPRRVVETLPINGRLGVDYSDIAIWISLSMIIIITIICLLTIFSKRYSYIYKSGRATVGIKEKIVEPEFPSYSEYPNIGVK